MKKVVLAFSGGLDTTFCAVWLQQQGYEVHACAVNTGGFSTGEEEALKARAHQLGLANCEVLNIEEHYYHNCIKYLIAGNVLKNNTYPLSVSAERVFQAKAIADFAYTVGADAIAHGSTGAGNDQVRFDMIFNTVCPEAEIITPIRDLKLSREEEVEFLVKHGVTGDFSKSMYSINQGLWGTSVGGKETLTSNEYLPEEAFPSQLTEEAEVELTITFEAGEPVAINNEQCAPVECIKRINALGSRYGIGRDIHVGDTVIGIKGRVGFEAPGPSIIIKAHHLLEKHVLSKHQLLLKDQWSILYGHHLHEGLFLDPVMRDIEAFLHSSQKYVTGDVKLLLRPYQFTLLGIASPHDLMQSEFGKYGEMNAGWSGEDVRGFAKIFGNQMMIYQKTHANE